MTHPQIIASVGVAKQFVQFWTILIFLHGLALCCPVEKLLPTDSQTSQMSAPHLCGCPYDSEMMILLAMFIIQLANYYRRR